MRTAEFGRGEAGWPRGRTRLRGKSLYRVSPARALKAERNHRKLDTLIQKYFEILAERAQKHKMEHHPNHVIEYYKEPGGSFL